MTIQELIEGLQKYPLGNEVGIYLSYPGRFSEYDGYYTSIDSIDDDKDTVYLNVE